MPIFKELIVCVVNKCKAERRLSKKIKGQPDAECSLFSNGLNHNEECEQEFEKPEFIDYKIMMLLDRIFYTNTV